MAYDIAQLKADLTGILRGTTLNKVVGIYDVISRAARHVVADVDIPETKRIAQLNNPIFDQVYDYVLPADLKSNKIIDIRPINNRSLFDNYQTQSYAKDFDFLKQWMSGNQFNIRTNNGIKTLRVSDNYLTPSLAVESLDSLTDNGTWASGGSFSTATIDTLQFVAGSGSIRVDGTGSSGYIENSTLDAVDLSDETLTSFFVWVYIPAPTTFTSLNLRWGSSSSDYYHATVTAGHLGAWVSGWNLVRFDWDGSTVVGTPVDTAIDYLRITAIYTGDQDNLRFDSILHSKGRIFDLEYYSKYLFRGVDGTWKEQVTLDTDIVNADTDSYNLLLYKTAELIGLNNEEPISIRNKSVNIGQQSNGNMYDDLLTNFKQTNKSEAIVPQTYYYRMPYSGRRAGYHG